jgi:hypothetical protein
LPCPHKRAELRYPFVHRFRLVDGILRATALDRAQAVVAREDLPEDLRS